MRVASLRGLLVARGLRAFGDGFVSVLLPVYLLGLGFTPFQVGAIVTATLLGSAALTLLVGCPRTGSPRAAARRRGADGRHRPRLRGVAAFWPLLVVAFVGTLNPSSRRRERLPAARAGGLLAQAGAGATAPRCSPATTWSGALAGALGALGSGLPELLRDAERRVA